MLRRALVCCFFAVACDRASVARPPEPMAVPPERGHAIGVVTGAPWIGGGPVRHRTWQAIQAIDARHDIVPVDLDRTIERTVDVLIVPQLPSLSQPQLDRLQAAIDDGISAIVVADPAPIVDLKLMPGEPSFDESFERVSLGPTPPGPPKGDAATFLARLGVAWQPDRVLVDKDHTEYAGLGPLELVGGDVTAPLPGPVLLWFAGAIEPTDHGVAFTPLVTTRAARLGPIADYLDHHPLFGPQLTEARTPNGTEARARTVVARIDPPRDTRRGAVIVAADLDVFGDSWIGHEQQGSVTIANTRLLPALVAVLAGAGRDPDSPENGAPLLDRAARDEVVEIDLVSQRDRVMPPELGSELRRASEWVRLRRDASRWSLRSLFEQPADSARVNALLDALERARWEPGSPAAAELRDPSESGTSDAIRIVVRNTAGVTVLDAVIAGSGDPRVARATFDQQLRTVRLELDGLLTGAAFARGIDVGAPRSEIASATVTTYSVDAAQGQLKDVVPKPATAATLDALLSARFFPVRKQRVLRPDELVGMGFFATPDATKLYGSIGDVELERKDGTTIHVIFGAKLDRGRAVMIEGRDRSEADVTWIYAVDETTALRVLAGE